MKPENKIPVLDRISDEMKTVVNFHRDDLPPRPPPMTSWPNANTISTNGNCGMPMPRR